jgi:hypothetical protein
MSFKNLAILCRELYGGMKETMYKKCKDTIIEETIHEFKNKKLKDRGDKIIKNKDQAIAIALSQSHSMCTRNSSEIKKLIDKVDRDLNNIKKLNLTDVIETYDAIKILIKKGKYKKVYTFKKLLWDKIIKQQLNNIIIDTNIWEEIRKINNL